MRNPAPADFPVHELARERWSPRAFDPKRSVDEATLRSLLEAARWAPSAYNEQPWAYVHARREDPESFARILSCLVPGNQRWAKDAAVLMISAAKLALDRTGQPNRHAFHDVGQAAAWLTVEAESRGLRVHQMAGIELEKCRSELGVPEGWEACAGLAIGYEGRADQLPDDLKQRESAPRSRRPQSQWAFSGRWGTAATGGPAR